MNKTAEARSFPSLIAELEREMKRQNYLSKTINTFKTYWLEYQLFCNNHGKTCPSSNMGKKFLEDQYEIVFNKESVPYDYRQLYAIRAVQVLEQYYINGVFLRLSLTHQMLRLPEGFCKYH